VPDFRDLHEDFQEQHPVWLGRVARTVTQLDEPVLVTIPDWDDELQWGPCRWQSRDDTNLPRRGDHCLVIFDNRREPWVVSWWPF
jgi:hypothetical protein